MSQAQGGLQSVRLRFQAGEDTQLDVISAEDELTQAEGNLSRAILNYNRALAALERAIALEGTQRQS